MMNQGGVSTEFNVKDKNSMHFSLFSLSVCPCSSNSPPYLSFLTTYLMLGISIKAENKNLNYSLCQKSEKTFLAFRFIISAFLG
jgi:hypothetical protein